MSVKCWFGYLPAFFRPSICPYFCRKETIIFQRKLHSFLQKFDIVFQWLESFQRMAWTRNVSQYLLENILNPKVRELNIKRIFLCYRASIKGHVDCLEYLLAKVMIIA